MALTTNYFQWGHNFNSTAGAPVMHVTKEDAKEDFRDYESFIAKK